MPFSKSKLLSAVTRPYPSLPRPSAKAWASPSRAVLLTRLMLPPTEPALGQGYELDAIAAVVIGGTSLSGGTGTIVGTIIGAFIMSVLTNGLRILSVAQEWQTVVTGVIIILAVYADILRRRSGSKAH